MSGTSCCNSDSTFLILLIYLPTNNHLPAIDLHTNCLFEAELVFISFRFLGRLFSLMSVPLKEKLVYHSNHCLLHTVVVLHIHDICTSMLIYWVILIISHVSINNPLRLLVYTLLDNLD